MDWNPVDWVKDAAGAAGGVASTVANWVIAEVTKAVDLVENDIGTAYQGAISFAQEVESVASDLFTEAEHDITQAADRAYGEVASLFAQAEHDVTSAADWVLSEAEGAASALFHDAESAIGAVASTAAGLFETAEHDLTTAADWAYEEATSLFADAEHDIVNAADWAISEAESVASTALHDFEVGPVRWFLDAVDVFQKAFGWIEWFAVHTFDDLTSLMQSEGETLWRDLESPEVVFNNPVFTAVTAFVTNLLES